MAEVSRDKAGVSGFLANIPTFIQQVKAEWGKVAWPTRRETVMTAVMVVIMTLTLGIFFFGVDWIFSRIVATLVRLAA